LRIGGVQTLHPRSSARNSYRIRLEPNLALAVRKYGPFIAIGRPGERLATEGASRLYVADENWRDVVRAAIAEARTVIWQAGITENVLWELQSLVVRIQPQNILLIFPRQSDNFFPACCAAANAILPKPIDARGTPFTFVAFKADWEPVYISIGESQQGYIAELIPPLKPRFILIRNALKDHFR
jgi:hypothetical protein